MNKFFHWLGNNLLFLLTLLLLIVIPLYPKIPLVDVQNTWVYVRIEDFLVAAVFVTWVGFLLRKKVTLKTPLTIPIMLFWIIGGLATLHGVFFIFATLQGVHANVAFLSFLRHIEYLSLFFVAFTSIRDKKNIYPAISVISIVLLLVCLYGLGQRYLGFPAYLTMNEEFAKGIPIELSAGSRISSTFAGHYDLAAYLVLIIPIIVSLIFGFKNILVKLFLLGVSFLGFIVLFMTISRVSFVVLLVSVGIVLMFQKKRLVIASLLLLSVIVVAFSGPILQRFGSTVTETEVLVDAQTGRAIGPVQEVNNTYFKDSVITIRDYNPTEKSATNAAILPYLLVPKSSTLLVEPNRSEGEDLTQGTSYINLSLSPVVKKVDMYFFEKANPASKAADVYFGDYVIKKAKAYDLSSTTRFQGEWPKTLEAFEKNIFIGSGYGAVSLAVDNNYLRILGESGLLGLIAFISLFIISGIYIVKTLPHVESPIVKTYVLGFVAGSIGLALNAFLIDVFEASKVAFTYWSLMGITLGILHLYQKENIDMLSEFKKTMTSVYAIGIYFLVIIVGLFFSSYGNYFLSMDYTWLHIASSCYSASQSSLTACTTHMQTIFSLFSKTVDMYYRPAALLYFYIMHSAFWLDQTMYHVVSLTLYFIVAVLVLLLSKRVFNSHLLAAGTSGIFLLLAGHTEVLLWISATDILFATVLILLSLLGFIEWEKSEKKIYLFISVICAIIAPYFHESALISVFCMVLYDMLLGKKLLVHKNIQKKYFNLYAVSVLLYIFSYFFITGKLHIASYNFLLLPINYIGYILLGIFGPASIPVYTKLYILIQEHTVLLFPLVLLLGSGIGISFFLIKKYISEKQRNILFFACGFFTIAIIPFLGMESIQPKSGYVANIGIAILLTILLQNIYNYLEKTQEKLIASCTVGVILITFCMLQIFQIQALEDNWQSTSQKSEDFLISFGQHYSDEWKKGTWNFYFVHTPVGIGQPWVYPSSLKDAIWFVTQNPQTNIIAGDSIENGLNFASNHLNTHVFEFEDDGKVREIKRIIKDGKPVIIKR